VLSVERLNASRYTPLAIAIFFILTGDYPSFFTHIKAII
jgi:hypothetical protein